MNHRIGKSHIIARMRILGSNLWKTLKILCACSVLVASIPNLFAIKIPKPTLSGDFSSYFETYGSNRLNNKRPPGTYRFSLSGSVGLPFFSLGLGLFYTSEDKFTAQRVSQFNLKPAWAWGSIDFGDFTPSFTEYTLSGFQIRGLGINLFPKSFRFSFVGGESKRARDTIEKSYKRNLYGLRLGTTFLCLNILRVKDDEKSLPPTDTARPQENLVVGIESNLSLFKRLNLYFEGDASFHTRDLRSDTLRHEKIPKIVFTFYQPRRSSKVDYALKSGIKFNLKFLTLDLALNQVGPGYTSLGVPYLKNDARKGRITISTQMIPKTALSLMVERENDNLVQDKLATTKASGLGLSLRFSPVKKLNIITNLLERRQRKETERDSFSVNTLTRTLLFSPNYSYNISDWQQNSNITFSYQQFENSIAVSAARLPSTRTFTFGLNHSLNPLPVLTISFAFNRSHSILAQEQRSQMSFALSLNHRGLNNRLNNNLALSYLPASTGKNYRIAGRTGYSLTKYDAINLDWNLSWFNSIGSSFSERQVSLSYSRKIF